MAKELEQGTTLLAREVLWSHNARYVSAIGLLATTAYAAVSAGQSIGTLIGDISSGFSSRDFSSLSNDLLSPQLINAPLAGVGLMAASQLPAFLMNSVTTFTAKHENSPLAEDVKTAARWRVGKRIFGLATIPGIPFLIPGGVPGGIWLAGFGGATVFTRRKEAKYNGIAIDRSLDILNKKHTPRRIHR